MEWLSKPTKRLLFEMSIGILLYNLLLGGLACLVMPKASYPVMPVLAGLLCGAAGAVLMLVHMAVTMERALDSQNESYASKTTIVQSMIRKVVLVAALFFCWRVFGADPLAMVVGAMGLKAGAYLQPLVHRAFGGGGGAAGFAGIRAGAGAGRRMGPGGRAYAKRRGLKRQGQCRPGIPGRGNHFWKKGGWYMGMLISNEPDFMIHDVLHYQMFGQDLYLTTTTVGMWIVTILILLIAVLANRTLKKASDVPGAFQNALEYAYEMLENMAKSILGGNSKRFMHYIGTIFLFILFCNLSGLLGLRAPTADFGVTFLLGMFTFFIVNYQGIKNRKVRHFTSLFEPTPILFPINLIGELANPLSISLRLFANLLSGVIIMGLWYGMMPILLDVGIPAALHLYCDLFSGCIQTYVFCMLTMVYINDKLE